MNKTQRILACVGNVRYESIKDIVGCSEQLVYTILKSDMARASNYTPKHKGFISKKKKQCSFKLTKGMLILINGSSIEWEITFIGNEFVSIKNGYDKRNVTKDKIKRVV